MSEVSSKHPRSPDSPSPTHLTAPITSEYNRGSQANSPLATGISPVLSTPPRKIRKIGDETTPVVARTGVESAEYQEGFVHAAREKLFTDYPQAHQVPIDEFLEAYLRLPSDFTINAVYDRLAAQDVYNNPNMMWSNIPLEPGATSLSEDAVYTFVKDLFESVVAAAQQANKFLPSVECVLYPSRELKGSGEKPNKARPDGSLMLSKHVLTQMVEVEARLDYHYYRMAVLMEFKKSTEDTVQNIKQAIWGMHHTMRDDPRRRFIFGLTIENTTVRLHFHDRASMIVSEPFDLHKDWKTLVHAFCAFARLDWVDLGFDDSVRLVGQKDNKYIFDIDVYPEIGPCEDPVTFRTVEKLSDFAANAIVGRGTRVWKVRQVDKYGKWSSNTCVVLKDCWQNADRVPEHQTLARIKEALKDDPRAKHFLTCQLAGRVPYRGQRGSPDNTHLVIRRKKQFSTIDTFKFIPEKKKQDDERLKVAKDEQRLATVHFGAVPLGPVFSKGFGSGLRDINAGAREHYRFVFEEIGESILHLEHYQPIFFALQGALCGLEAMHEKGFIHRDVSIYNVILVRRQREKGRGCRCSEVSRSHGPLADLSKHSHSRDVGIPGEDCELVPIIMDLEYATHINDRVIEHEVRTGTIYFTALEVSCGEWILPEALVDNEAFSMSRPPFYQHWLHDIEPLVWIVIWTLYCFFPKDGKILRPVKFDESYHGLFSVGNADARERSWRDPGNMRIRLREGLPSQLWGLVDVLIRWMREYGGLRRMLYSESMLDRTQVHNSPRRAGIFDCSWNAFSSLDDLIRESPLLWSQLAPYDYFDREDS